MRSRDLYEKITSVPLRFEPAGDSGGTVAVGENPASDSRSDVEAPPRIWALPFDAANLGIEVEWAEAA